MTGGYYEPRAKLRIFQEGPYPSMPHLTRCFPVMPERAQNEARFSLTLSNFGDTKKAAGRKADGKIGIVGRISPRVRTVAG